MADLSMPCTFVLIKSLSFSCGETIAIDFPLVYNKGEAGWDQNYSWSMGNNTTRILSCLCFFIKCLSSKNLRWLNSKALQV